MKCSNRSKWSKEEIQQLKIIYSQELNKGRKKLWIRVSERINSTVRQAKRQAIEYKWKNFCRILPNKNVKLCKNQDLIELLFKMVPYKGYHQLIQLQDFQDMYFSEQLKNLIQSQKHFLFEYQKSLQIYDQYSGYFIKTEINNENAGQQKIFVGVTNQENKVLRFQKQQKYNEENINNLKSILKHQKGIQVEKEQIKFAQELKEQILSIYYQMRNIYNHSFCQKMKGTQTTIEEDQSLMYRINEEKSLFPHTIKNQTIIIEASNNLIKEEQCIKQQKQENPVAKSFIFITEDWQNEKEDNNSVHMSMDYLWLCNQI